MAMRRPDQLEVLYLDFDGFFASVAQQADPRLRGKPVGIVPFDAAPTKSMTVIAVSKEAKRLGVKNVMRVPDVLAICPEIILVPLALNFVSAGIIGMVGDDRTCLTDV